MEMDIKVGCLLTKGQLTAVITFAIWGHHWAAKFEDKPFHTEVAIKMARATAASLTLHLHGYGPG